MTQFFPVQWEEHFATGIPTVDTQHQELIAILNELGRLVETGPSHKDLLDTVARLADYAHYHFAEEERLMESIDYGELDEHRLEHINFTNQIDLFDLDAILATEGLAWDMLHFLRTWLCDHILGTDQRFGTAWRQHHDRCCPCPTSRDTTD
jgi:hemerythrin